MIPDILVDKFKKGCLFTKSHYCRGIFFHTVQGAFICLRTWSQEVSKVSLHIALFFPGNTYKITDFVFHFFLFWIIKSEKTQNLKIS